MLVNLIAVGSVGSARSKRKKCVCFRHQSSLKRWGEVLVLHCPRVFQQGAWCMVMSNDHLLNKERILIACRISFVSHMQNCDRLKHLHLERLHKGWGRRLGGQITTISISFSLSPRGSFSSYGDREQMHVFPLWKAKLYIMFSSPKAVMYWDLLLRLKRNFQSTLFRWGKIKESLVF